jgi:hypothetical protein
MGRRMLLALAAVAAAAGPARAQVRAGAEFGINTYTTNRQWFPNVAMGPDGDFVVVWNSMLQDGSYTGIFGRRHDRTGAAIGAEFQVNTFTTGFQMYYGRPAVAGDGKGNFVVAWASYFQVDKLDVFAQRFSAAGPLGSEFQVNTATIGNQGGVDVYGGVSAAMDRRGNFVVAWQHDTDGDTTGIRAQRFDPSGARVGAEFQVNTYTTGYQGTPEVAMDAGGGFLVVWSTPDGIGTGVAGQRYDASGARVGGEFLANSYTAGTQSYFIMLGPSLGMNGDGSFVVAWDGQPGDGSSYGVLARRFDAAANPLGAEFLVNTYTTSYQLFSRVATDSVGNFVVAWESFGQDGSSFGTFARRYDRGGTPRGGEFQVNTATADFQGVPDVRVDRVGNFLVAGHGRGADGAFDVFAQRYGGLAPRGLEVDGGGNGVLEPGETASLRPAWNNFNGAAQVIGGALVEVTGPSGASYTIEDANAAYDSVPDGGTAACSECYTLTVSDPPARPLTHWDVSVLETIRPDTHGQRQRWPLHVGESFTDVPPSSPFYRFVETVLHHGVTAGCSAAQYCPAGLTSREQMAVFVLAAKEGPDFTPPACAPPNVFDDVPQTSAFCRWIEELARRGVVAGCGGGNYCPAADVTREQMALFVLRTLDPTLDPPACGAPLFADVPADSPFCRWIEELARRGVVTGCGGGNYCPAAPVSREQMAVFIGATFGLALYGI